MVLACGRRFLSDAGREEIARLAESCVDWDAIDAFARRHGLLPLLFRHLPAIAGDRIPRRLYAIWWAECDEIARRNGRMARELAAIVATLRDRGIEAIPYKGPTLAIAAYGDVALREFLDLDLLLAPSRVHDAVAALSTAGYRSALALSPDATRELVMRSRHYEWPLIHEVSGTLVELHWRADPEYRVVDMENAPSALPPSLLAMMLCLHGTKHFWTRAAWLADIVALADAACIDWGWIARESRRLGCARHVALAPLLASRLFGMAPPAAFEAELRDPIVADLAEEIAAEIYGDGPRYAMSAEFRRNVTLRRGIAAKSSYLWHAWMAPGRSDWERWNLPGSLSALYWPLRPIRLAEKYLLKRTPAAARPRTPPPQPRSTG